MNKKDVRDIIKTAVSLFLICAVAAGLLAAVNSVTAPKIAENSAATANEARKTVLPEAESFEEKTLSDGTVYYAGVSGYGKVGYVFNTSAAGYGGEIALTVGVNSDGAVTGITILTINETPGLGMNAKKESFISQFTGKSGSISVVKGSASGDNEISAITSATITSKAVTSAVNKALELYSLAVQQEG